MGIIKNIFANEKSITKNINEISKKKKLSSGLQYFLKAEALRNSELFNESVRFYLSSLLIENKNPKCYFGLAYAYKQLYEYEKAIKILNQAKKIIKNTYELHYELGILYLLCNNPQASIKELKTAILLNKEKIEAQIQLAKAHEILEDFEMAEKIYLRIIEFFPKNITTYNHLGNLYINLGMYHHAGYIYKALLKINPNFAQAYFGLGICFEKMNKINDAIRYFRKFSQLTPNSINSPEIKKHLAKLKVKTSNKEIPLKIVK